MDNNNKRVLTEEGERRRCSLLYLSLVASQPITILADNMIIIIGKHSGRLFQKRKYVLTLMGWLYLCCIYAFMHAFMYAFMYIYLRYLLPKYI